MDTPTSKTSTAAQGHVEFQGFAWPGETFFPSRFGQRLVYYQFSLQKQVTVGSGKSKRTRWVDVYQFTFHDPFYILDQTGLVRVHPLGATFNLRSRSAIWNSLQEKYKKFFCTHVIKKPVANFPPGPSRWTFSEPKFRINESFIPMGAPLHITGHFETKTNSPSTLTSAGLTDFADKVINFKSRSLKNIEITLDDNDDNLISEEEHSNGYSKLASSSLQTATKIKSEEKVFPLFGHLKNTIDNTMTISDTHENYLRNRLGGYLWLKFALSIYILSAGTYYLLKAIGFGR